MATDLSGYGLRGTGEQEFYAFYVNLGSGAPAPFTSGVNLILESRKAFLASPAAGILENTTTQQQFNESKLACLWNSQVTSRTTNSTPSETGIAGTFSVNLTADPSCASTLLMELSARNATGVTVGQNRTLSSTQIALLGLSTQVAQVAAYLPPVGFNSDPGGGPSGVLQSIVETATTYFVGVLVAVGNFIAAVAKDVVALGQLILGAIAKVLSAVAAAARAALSAIESFLNFVLSIAQQLLQIITSPLTSGIASYATGNKNAMVNEAHDLPSRGGKGITTLDGQSYWYSFAGPVFSVSLGVAAALTVTLVVLSAFTLGTSFLSPLLVKLLIGPALQGYGLAQGGSVPHSLSNTGSAAIFFIEGLVNATGGHPSANNSTGSGLSQAESWNISAADAATLFSDLFTLSVPLVTYVTLYELYGVAGSVGEMVLGITLSVLSLIWDWESINHNSLFCGTQVFPLIFSFLGAAMDWDAYYKGEIPGPLAGVGFSTGLLGISVSLWSYTHQHC